VTHKWYRDDGQTRRYSFTKVILKQSEMMYIGDANPWHQLQRVQLHQAAELVACDGILCVMEIIHIFHSGYRNYRGAFQTVLDLYCYAMS